jgi:hypothetical protein
MQRRKEGLLRLRQNVVLLRDEADPQAFHPRFNLMETSSFKELNSGWQQTLRTLHDLHFFQRQVRRQHRTQYLPTHLALAQYQLQYCTLHDLHSSSARCFLTQHRTQHMPTHSPSAGPVPAAPPVLHRHAVHCFQRHSTPLQRSCSTSQYQLGPPMQDRESRCA